MLHFNKEGKLNFSSVTCFSSMLISAPYPIYPPLHDEQLYKQNNGEMLTT